MHKPNPQYSEKELQTIAKELRVWCIKMITAAGNGHPGGSLSLAEIVTALYFKVLNHNPQNPSWHERDRFVLSKGHGVPAVYAALAMTGYFPEEKLLSLRQLGSPLQGHPDRVRLPGIEASTGSLGQGLSIAQGIALATRLDKLSSMVYCVLGDGEIQEGQVWEAALSVPMHRLDHLCAIVDWNKGQIDGQVKDVMNVEPIADKFAAFGWHVLTVNGHDFPSLISALDKAKQNAKAQTGKPTLIVADTLKGKGVKFMEEGKNAWHGAAPSKEQAEIAIKEITGSQQ